jgi:hypothetical protein
VQHCAVTDGIRHRSSSRHSGGLATAAQPEPRVITGTRVGDNAAITRFGRLVHERS